MVTPLTNHLLNGMILQVGIPPKFRHVFSIWVGEWIRFWIFFNLPPSQGCQSPPWIISSSLNFPLASVFVGVERIRIFFFLPPDSGTHHLIPRFFLDFLLTKLVGSLERKRSFSNQWKFPAIRKHEKKSIVWMISAVSKMLFGTVMAGQRTPPGPRTPPRNSRPY